MIHIVPKNKKLLKSSKVRKYIKELESVIIAKLEEQKVADKMQEALVLGVPLKFHDDGRIEVVKDYYRKKKSRCKRKQNPSHI